MKGSAQAALGLLRSDAVVLAAVGGAVVAVALEALEALSGWSFYLENTTGLFFVLLTVVALLAGRDQLPSRDERRFWSALAVGFGFWALVLTLYLTVPEAWWTPAFDLAGDSLYLLFYLVLLAAVDGRPDLRFERRTFAPGGRYRLPGVVVFSAGLFAYFVVVPAALSPSLYGSFSPSLLFFLALDVYLLIRLLVLNRIARTARWRRVFALAAAVVGLFLVSDLAELLALEGVLPADPGLFWNALWLVPGVAIIAAVRLRALPVAATPAESDDGWASVETLALGAPFLAYALVLPLIHFAAYRAALFDEVTRPVHESLVLLWLVALGAVSLVQYLELRRQHDSLLDQRRMTEERLWQLANFDQLTGLPNRVLFRDRFAHALKQGRRSGRLVAVVFSDLDDFKRVNDSYGHAAGDQLLSSVARRMVASVRDSDTVARLGGDEFTVILEALDDYAHVERLARRISEALSRPFEVGGQTVTLGSSLGVGIYPRDGEDVDTLLASADAAMYEGKRGAAARGKVRFFTQAAHGEWRDRLRLENELRRAVADDRLALDYQPIWSLAEGRWSGAEALVRWRHPGRGLLMPETFIPLAERTGLIEAIGGWVLATARRDLEAWHRQGLDLYVAVNLSAGQFHDEQLPRRIAGRLEALGLPPSSLEIELTETTVFRDVEGAARICSELAALGVRVVIDDFGAGQTSLRHLTRLSPAKIKIDRSLFRGVESDPKAAAVVAGIVAMAHRLELAVVAEGVETAGERAFAEAQGCDEIQGFLLARPQPAASLTRLVAAPRGAEIGHTA